jgi:hypothetical protein
MPKQRQQHYLIYTATRSQWQSQLSKLSQQTLMYMKTDITYGTHSVLTTKFYIHKIISYKLRDPLTFTKTCEWVNAMYNHSVVQKHGMLQLRMTFQSTYRSYNYCSFIWRPSLHYFTHNEWSQCKWVGWQGCDSQQGKDFYLQHNNQTDCSPTNLLFNGYWGLLSGQ